MDNIEVFYMAASEFDPEDEDSWMGDRVREELAGMPGYRLAERRQAALMGDGTAELDYAEADIKAAQQALAGWYFWVCVPGCMPDSDASGPYKTEDEALEEARDMYGEDES